MKTIIFILSLFSSFVFAHTNTVVKKIYGNVTVISSTTYKNEAINRNLITGQYAQILSSKLSYSGSILLYLVDNGSEDFRIWLKNPENNDDLDLNIFILNPEIEIVNCLNLLEKAIANRKALKKNINKFSTWYSKNPSVLTAEVLENKIERPKDVEELKNLKFFTYYYQNQTYHVLCIDNCETKEIATFKNIVQFSEPKYYHLCVFQNETEISLFQAKCKYNFDEKKYFVISERADLTIEGPDKDSRPYNVDYLGKDLITFESYWGEKVLVYSLSKKVFIQDLNKIIKE